MPDDNIIRCIRFACWITKATDTLIIGNIHRVPIAIIVPPTYTSVSLCIRCLFC
jgi:hypothetical protein